MKTALSQLSAKDARIIDEVLRHLKKRYRRSLKQVILYGSKARGEATEESDIDLLVVLSKVKDFWQTVKEVGEIADKVLLEHGVLISAIPVAETELRNRRASPFFMNIKREGILIYGC
jgi:predicted nucleotidyltransferase